MMTGTIIPTNITFNQNTERLVINWADGRTCEYPIGPLRLACPCVECRGGHERMGEAYEPKNLLDLIPTRAYHIEELQLVGNYALQIFWDDGHRTGIYTWDYLYRLCPAEDDNA